MQRTLETIVNRAASFAGAYGATRTRPERVDALAIAQLSATAAMQQLELFAHWCYQRADTGQLLHILPSGQLPSGAYTPWGASGKSGMTRPDRDILRVWLALVDEKGFDPVWVYVGEQRRWYVDLMNYPSLAAALDWLQQTPIQAKDWLTIGLCMRRSKTHSVKGYLAVRQKSRQQSAGVGSRV
jgi:hypothetical protein